MPDSNYAWRKRLGGGPTTLKRTTIHHCCMLNFIYINTNRHEKTPSQKSQQKNTINLEI